MSLETDPFTKVYAAIWGLLEKNADFCKLVDVGNRIRLDGDDRRPNKREVSTRDLPEVRIVPTQLVPHAQRTSNSSTCELRLEVQVSTGDWRVHEQLFPLEWAIYRALVNWELELKSLTWNNRPFVQVAQSLGVNVGRSESDIERGIQGWAGVWACMVDLWFNTADLL